MHRLQLLTALAVVSAATPALAQTEAPVVARVTVRLPAEAKLYVDAVLCPLASNVRCFETPPLAPGRRYLYTLRVELVHDGQTVSASKRVSVRGGTETTVDFGDRRAILATLNPPAEEPLRLPEQPAPMQALARLEEDSFILQRPVQEVITQTVKVLVEKDGVKEEREKVVLKTLVRTLRGEVAVADVQVLDSKGKPLSLDSVRDTLRKDTVVLVAAEPKVDPFYLQTVREGTLILVIKGLLPALPPRASPLPPILEKGFTPSPGPADGAAALPRGPRATTPRQARASLEPDGQLVVRETVRTMRVETRTDKGREGQDREKVTVPYPVAVPVSDEVVKRWDLKKVRVYGSDGKRIDAARLPELLQRETTVLISTDFQAIDPSYLPLLRPGTLILVPPSEPSRRPPQPR